MDKIFNPLTKRFISINGKQGQQILKKYINQFGASEKINKESNKISTKLEIQGHDYYFSTKDKKKIKKTMTDSKKMIKTACNMVELAQKDILKMNEFQGHDYFSIEDMKKIEKTMTDSKKNIKTAHKMIELAQKTILKMNELFKDIKIHVDEDPNVQKALQNELDEVGEKYNYGKEDEVELPKKLVIVPIMKNGTRFLKKMPINYIFKRKFAYIAYAWVISSGYFDKYLKYLKDDNRVLYYVRNICETLDDKSFSDEVLDNFIENLVSFKEEQGNLTDNPDYRLYSAIRDILKKSKKRNLK